jgi:hypothetical protein
MAREQAAKKWIRLSWSFYAKRWRAGNLAEKISWRHYSFRLPFPPLKMRTN